jgi:RNA polymerase sigma-70 factor (ECF subfamily)
MRNRRRTAHRPHIYFDEDSEPRYGLRQYGGRWKEGYFVTLTEFERFLQRHEKDVYSFCRYLTMDRDTADELYQDTVLQAFEMIDGIDVTKNPKSLLFSIAVGKWKNARRKVGRRNGIAPTVPLEDFAEGIANGETADSDSPERRAESALARDCVRAALARMDDRLRIPLILFYFDDCSVGTVSQICKIPEGTVKSRLHKGRVVLKNALMKEGFEYEG